MNDLLPPASLFLTFLAASFVLAVTPGPGVFYIVTRSLSQGRVSGLMSVAGVAAGNLVNAVGAACGLAALFAISSLAFMMVKYVGAAYLVYLGVKALLSASVAVTPDVVLKSATPGKIFSDGFVVAALNPKTTLFFAAFLPQFLGVQQNPAGQSIMLGSIFVLIAAFTDSLYALGAGTIRPWLAKSGVAAGNFGRYLTGCAFISLGLLTAFSGRKR